jgi:hypothetical protein
MSTMTSTATSTLTPAGIDTARTEPALRLTRRGRTLVVLLLAAVLFGAFSLGRSASQATGPGEATGPALVQTTVQPGESLWSVAQRIAPDNDPREVIAQIRRINDLESSQLLVGQQLLLPVQA